MAPLCLDDLRYWLRARTQTASRLVDLIEETLRDPSAGRGQPEPLKIVGGTFWSRRLTSSDRLVYRVFDDRIEFIQARFHYGRSD